MPQIHPTAIVDPAAVLGDDVEIGPHCVIEPDVEIGAGCRLRENVIVRRYTTLGRNNFVDAFVVLGGGPQDLKFDPATVSYLRIGHDNVMREGVTISRATGEGNTTLVGSGTYWMANSHAGHNAVIQDGAILVNGSLVAGYAEIGNRAIISGGAVVHQFTWVGDMVMTRGLTGMSMHVPPYTITVGMNRVAGLNSVGLRRAKHISDTDRQQIRDAFRITYRKGASIAEALAEMDAHTEWGQAGGKFREFVRRVTTAEPPYNRGLCGRRVRRHEFQ